MSTANLRNHLAKVCLVAALFALRPLAAEKPRETSIWLNAGVVDTASAEAQARRTVALPAAGKAMRLIQFSGPIQPTWHAQMVATGVQVICYIPDNAYLVYGDAAALSRLQVFVASGKGAQWEGAYLDTDRIHPDVAKGLPSPGLSVQLWDDPDANPATLSLVGRLGTKPALTHKALGYVNVVLFAAPSAALQLAARPDVVSIQQWFEPKPNDERQDMIISGNLTGGAPNPGDYLAWLASKGFTQSQFTASGFGVDVSDSGIDNGTLLPNHFGFYVGGNVANASRVSYARFEGTGTTLEGCDGHGTLNAHIIGGYSAVTDTWGRDAAGFHYGLGVAPFVKVGSSVIFGPSWTDPIYQDLQSRAYRDGMRISSNSWGYTSGNSYTVDSQQYDALVRDAQPTGSAVPAPGNQEMVIVFAAGNNGSGANTVAPPGTGKNLLVAGATEGVQAFGAADQCGVADSGADSAMDVINFSSRGPTSDGRKKPDLMAPGTHISGGVAQTAGQRANPPAVPTGSANPCFDASGVCAGPGSSNFWPLSQQWYTASSGTSHSTPAIAGGAALVRQYFLNHGWAPPSPAMTKAFLMSSARYMTGLYANDNLYSNNQGMGLMDLGMAFDDVRRVLEDQNPADLFTASGQTRTFNTYIGDATKPFRVTLAWTDAPGSTTGNAYNNNLDLTVTVGANTYLGNVFTGANSVTGGTADVRNNVESVFLPAGLTGPVTITVTATNINSDGVPNNASPLDQDFALVVFNTCPTPQPPAPTGVGASATAPNQVTVSFTPNGSPEYRVYRSWTAGGPYTRLGTTPTSPYLDTTVSGGSTYYYVVRAFDTCVESVDSNEASVTATGDCMLPPTFAGLTSATNGQMATCNIVLAWAAATPACGGTITYNVYRSLAPGFTPGIATRIASGLSGTSFTDDLHLVSGSTYHYIVRAVETGALVVEETNVVEKSASVSGAITPVTYLDDFDGNRPANASAYWIPTTQSGTSGTMNITTNCHWQSSNKSYRHGAASSTCGGSYPISTQATLSLGGDGSTPGINGFVVAPSAPRMTFNVWYDLESRYDGVWLAYSTTGAAGPWTNIGDAVSATAPYISAGGYDNTLQSSSTTRIWTSTNLGANGSLKAVTVNLDAIAGQRAWFAFKFYSDSSVVKEGFYVDNVRVDNSSVATCTTNTPPPGPAVRYVVSALPASVGAGTATSFTVAALDAVDQVATGYTGTASFTSSDPQATLPPNTAFTAGVAANVPITFGTMGTQSVTATDISNPAIHGTGSTTVTAGTPVAIVFGVQPTNTVAGVSIAPAPTVRIIDIYGNTTTSTVDITVAIDNNPGGGTLSGTTTVTAVAGIAAFPGLSIDKTGLGYTLLATSVDLGSAPPSAAFNITPAAATHLAFAQQPTNVAAGSSIAPAVTVLLLDAFENRSTSTANVSAAIGTNPSGGTLMGTSTVAAVNGLATFTNLSLDKVGTGYTLGATSTGVTAAVSAAFDVTPGPAKKLVYAQEPSNTPAGSPITPTVAVDILDRFDNHCTAATNTVTLSFGANPTGATLLGTTSLAAVAGTASFPTVAVSKEGLGFSLNAGSSGLTGASSVGFDVTAPCTTAPTFLGIGSANPGAGPTCSIALAWDAATASCGGTITYEVYRGTSPGFTPSDANEIATGISGLTHGDSAALVPGMTYYYVVRASENNGAVTNEDTNTVEVSAVAGGATSHFYDDFDSSRPATPGAWWLASSPTLNVVDGCRYQSATHAYRFGAAGTACGGSYPVSTTARLVLGGDGSTPGVNGFAIPAGGGAVLTFRHWYTLNQNDLARLEYSTAGAAGPWTAVPASYIVSGAYDVPAAWTGLNAPANGSLEQVMVRFDALAGSTVWVSWVFQSNSVDGAEGYHLDDVEFTTGGSCTSAVAAPGPAVLYEISGIPASTAPGIAHPFTVVARDTQGQVAISYNGVGTYTSSDPAATVLGAFAFDKGVANGTITFHTTGARTLAVQDVADPSLNGTVSTNVLPTAAVSGGTTICSGQSAPVQIALTGAAPWTLTWSDGFVQSGVGATPATRNVTPPATTTYTITSFTDANGAGIATGSASVTVKPTPTTPTPVNDGPICAGATLHLSTPTVAGATYSWTGPNGFVSATQNPAIANATTAATGTYSVSVTLDGCPSAAGTTAATVNSDTGGPTVTAPSPVTVVQAICCGVFGGMRADNPAVAGFVAGGIATDDCDPSPTRLVPQLGGVDITSSTCFEAGANAVTFRYQDSSGKTGTASASATVRMYGDLNLDSAVDTSDMVILRAYFNFAVTPGVPPFLAPLAMADLTHDGNVDPSDMVMVRAFFNFAVTCLAP